MAQRFCSRCNAEVEDAGGYCLLGHDLRLEAPVDSLKALRAEMNRTFDEARRELADVMAPAAVLTPELEGFPPPPAAASQEPSSRPAISRPVRLDEALVVEGHPDEAREWADATVAEVSEQAEARNEVAPATFGGSHTVWEGLDEEPALSPGDPITTFAPSPRMDWGPRRSRFGRRRAADEQPADA